MVAVKLNNHLTTQVAFLDVGQGDSSIIHTDDGLSGTWYTLPGTGGNRPGEGI